MYILIACMDVFRGIGNEGEVLYHIGEDLQTFKDRTINNVVIMGRKTLESLPGGKPLKDRINIVITHDKDYKCDNAIVCHSKDDVERVIFERDLGCPDKKFFVIGGESIYKMFIDDAESIYLTRATSWEKPKADAYFPEFEDSGKFSLFCRSVPKVSKNVTYVFEKWKRIDSETT